MNAASADASERDGARRIDVTTVRTGCVADFAETEPGNDATGFRRRGGWTYLVAEGTR